MEVCAGFELVVIENATALGHDVLEISKRGEVLVGEWLIEDGPEVLGGLQFGGIRRQEEQVHVLGDPQPHARRLPAGAIQDEDDPGRGRSACWGWLRLRQQRQQRRRVRLQSGGW